jgi:hypothetical protein
MECHSHPEPTSIFERDEEFRLTPQKKKVQIDDTHITLLPESQEQELQIPDRLFIAQKMKIIFRSN